MDLLFSFSGMNDVYQSAVALSYVKRAVSAVKI